MRTIPKDGRFDVTLAMLRDPYHFVAKRCRSLNADVFSSRLMLRKTIFMSGPAAAELFYTPDRFIRRKAPPHRLKQTLFGTGTVQNLDSDPHRHRKQMFISLLNGPGVDRLANQVRQEWEKAVPTWQKQKTVRLYPAIQEVLMRAVCAWAGVPLAENEVGKRTRQVVALFDGAGAVGPRHWWSRLSRKLAEAWLSGIIEDVRQNRLAAPEGALRTVALQSAATGQRMTARVAAAELLNILRPTVAISVYITFIAHALQQHPESLARLRDGDAAYLPLFINEVRRWYPFFPSVVARVNRDFEWSGYHFDKGTRTILDLHGTNHHADTWRDPDVFMPERFLESRINPFNLIPQGGGDAAHGHRCAGEVITTTVMGVAADFLANRLNYAVPAQDLSIDETRLPALPRSRFVMSEVSLAPAAVLAQMM